MKILSVFLIELLIFPVLSFFNVPSDIVSYTFITANAFSTILLISLSAMEARCKRIIVLGFLLRISLIILNYYTGICDNISIDSIKFHRIASFVADGRLTGVGLKGYYLLLSVLYKLFGIQKELAEYFNAMFGVGALLCMYNILKEIRASRKCILLIISIVCFSPFLVLYDASLLREAWIRFFAVFSLFLFVKWYNGKSFLYFLLANISVLAAAYMHNGILFLSIGYLIAYSLYDFRRKRSTFSIKSMFSIIFIIGIVSVIITQTDVFTRKFNSVLEADDMADVVESISKNLRDSGRSAYLTWINPESAGQILLYSPLKMIYFLFSPMPWDWSAVIDMVGFVFDSLVFLLLIGYVAINYKKIRRDKSLVKYLGLSLIITVFVFSYGTWNAGTAIRHRAKLLPLILTVYAVTRSEKEGQKTFRHAHSHPDK